MNTEKKYRIAVVGCGSMSKSWIGYAGSRPDCEIVAMVDLNQENARKKGEQYKLKSRVYSKLDEAIHSEKPNLVLDVTIPDAHKDVVRMALENGIPVFGEKPMAATLEDAKAMVSLSRKTGVAYFVMQNRRFLKGIRAFRKILSPEMIGEMGFVCADFFIGAHFGGFRDEMASPLVLDMAIHTFDQARFLIGADPVSVYCHEFSPKGSWYRGAACATCDFEFANGVVFSYRGSWCAEGCNTSWDSSWRLTGSKGSAAWDGKSMPYAEIAVDSDPPRFIKEVKRVEALDEWRGRESHPGCLDEMFTALGEGRKAETDCSDNIKSMAMVFGAIESSQTGARIPIQSA